MAQDKNPDPTQHQHKAPHYIVAARAMAWILTVSGCAVSGFLLFVDLKDGNWNHLWTDAAIAILSLSGGILCLLAVEAVNQLVRAASYAERSFLLLKLELSRIEDSIDKNTVSTDHIATELVEIKNGPLQQLFWLGHTNHSSGNEPS